MDSIIIKGKRFDTLVAITPREQEKGLMFQQWPPPIMTFPYQKKAVQRFWMKNTPSPLDIIFCSDDKIVSIARGNPMSTELVGPDTPCDMVVEIPAGMKDELGLRVGDAILFRPGIKTVARTLLELTSG